MKPVATPTPDTRAYFESIDAGVFALPFCAACETTFWYPRSICPSCTSADVGLREASGRGTVDSFVVNHRGAPGFEEDAPYVLALVRLAEGPVMTANVLLDDPGTLRVDDEVMAVLEPRGERKVLQFERVGGGS